MGTALLLLSNICVCVSTISVTKNAVLHGLCLYEKGAHDCKGDFKKNPVRKQKISCGEMKIATTIWHFKRLLRPYSP